MQCVTSKKNFCAVSSLKILNLKIYELLEVRNLKKVVCFYLFEKKDWQYNMTSVRYCSFDRDNSEVPLGNQFMETLVKDPPGVGTTCMGDYDPG